MTIEPLDRHYLQNSLFLAHAATACYENEPTRYKGFNRLHFDEIVSFPNDETRPGESGCGYIASNRDAIALAFRGTDEIEDWLINLNVRQIKDHGALVHRGFSQALDAVWPSLELKLKSLLKARPRKIFVTGHSLGGALATLAVLRIQRMGIQHVETYTFGQPRVGDRAMVRQIVTPFYRFAHYGDPVRFAPFSVPRAMHYKHAGTLKLIYASGRIVDQESSSVLRVFSNLYSTGRLAAEFRANNLGAFLAKRIKDHVMSNYIAQIEKNLPGLDHSGPSYIT